jgi:hypothetical protein
MFCNFYFELGLGIFCIIMKQIVMETSGSTSGSFHITFVPGDGSTTLFNPRLLTTRLNDF